METLQDDIEQVETWRPCTQQEHEDLLRSVYEDLRNRIAGTSLDEFEMLVRVLGDWLDHRDGKHADETLVRLLEGTA